MTAVRLDLAAWRSDPLCLTLGIEGVDLTAADYSFAVRLAPNTPGVPILLLIKKAGKGENGCRLVGVVQDTPGVPTSLLEIYADKATFIERVPLLGEIGDDVKLSYDFQWVLPDDGSGFSAVERTAFFGTLIIKGSVND